MKEKDTNFAKRLRQLRKEKEKSVVGFIGATKLAELAGVDSSTIRKRCISGKLKGTKVSKEWLVSFDAAEKFLISLEK